MITNKELKRLESALVDATKHRDRLRGETEKATAAVNNAVAARRDVLLSEDATLERVTEVERHAALCERTAASIEDALRISQTRVDAAALALASAQDEAARDKKADAILAHGPTIARTFAAAERPFLDLIEAFERAAEAALDARQVAVYLAEVLAAIRLETPRIEALLAALASEARRTPNAQPKPNVVQLERRNA
jgi:chromosome segregation ATPase